MTKIAEITGYQSVSAFSTAFKHQTGLSPTLHVQTLQMTLSTKRIRQAADQSAADQKKPAAAGFFAQIKAGGMLRRMFLTSLQTRIVHRNKFKAFGVGTQVTDSGKRQVSGCDPLAVFRGFFKGFQTLNCG